MTGFVTAAARLVIRQFGIAMGIVVAAVTGSVTVFEPVATDFAVGTVLAATHFAVGFGVDFAVGFVLDSWIVCFAQKAESLQNPAKTAVSGAGFPD